MNQMTGNVVTAVATALIMGVIAWAGGVFKAGEAALDEAQIKAVINQVLVLDDLRTYGQAITSIDRSVGEINVSLGHIKDDIDRIDGAVAALASE